MLRLKSAVDPPPFTADLIRMTSDIASIESLVEDYHRWVRDNTILKKVDSDWAKIVTPWVNVHNDCLEVYVREEKGQILLSDAGSVIQELEFMGINWNSGARNEAIRRTLHAFGASFGDGAAIEVRADRSNFPQKKVDLLQAMVAVGEFANVSTKQVGKMFADDVHDWLIASRVRYTEKVQLRGQSGFMHPFLGAIAPNRETSQPERMLLSLNSVKRDQVGGLIWSWQDVIRERRADAKLYVFLQDEGKGESLANVETAFKAYDIVPVRWSEREKSREALVA